MLVMAQDIFKGMADNWDKILASIGGMIKKVGDSIQRLSQMLKPNSLIGRFLKWAGRGISGMGGGMVARAAAMAPAYDARRRAKAFAQKGQLYLVV